MPNKNPCFFLGEHIDINFETTCYFLNLLNMFGVSTNYCFMYSSNIRNLAMMSQSSIAHSLTHRLFLSIKQKGVQTTSKNIMRANTCAGMLCFTNNSVAHDLCYLFDQAHNLRTNRLLLF